MVDELRLYGLVCKVVFVVFCLRTRVELQEFYVNAPQKLKPGLPIAQARQDERSLLAWRPIKNDAALIESAWMLADLYGFRGGTRRLWLPRAGLIA